MAIFTVHVPHDDGDAFGRADRTAFVRDGFSLPALLFGPLYLLRHRAWVAALAWIVVVAACAVCCRLLHLPGFVGVGLGLLIVLFTGLEASTIRRFTLNRRGLEAVDVVEGVNRDDSERAFFRRATATGLPVRRTVARPTGAPDEPVIGFFPDDGMRP